MKIFYLCIFLLILSGCTNGQEEKIVIDQCMRRQYFIQCLKSVPSGPVQTKYNDWSEIVSECADTAYYQSYRKASFVKPECRAS